MSTAVNDQSGVERPLGESDSPRKNPPNYGSLYGGIAVVGVALTGGQIYADVEQDGTTLDYLTLWQMLATPNGFSLAMGSLFLLGVLVVLCGVIAVRGVATPGAPIAVSSLALVAALMLTFKVGANHHYPAEFDTAGGMMLVTAWAAIILGVVHAVHLTAVRRRQVVSDRIRDGRGAAS